MEGFLLTLANGATLTGLANLPTQSPTTPRYRPLMVGLHGGTYSSAYFDVNEKFTAALASNGLGVPWVAIDRPGYKKSTSFNPIPDGSSYHEMYGEWLHKFILPALWGEFGVPQGCNGVVLLCHSLGTPGAVIAAALQTNELEAGEKPSYPLAGIVFSGFGTMPTAQNSANEPDDDAPPEVVNFPTDVKNKIFLPEGCCDPSVYEHGGYLNLPVPWRELHDIKTVWMPRFKTEFGLRVRVPVMFGIAELDVFWEGTEQHVRDFAAAFSGSPRVDGSLIRGATHNLEMNHWSHGWYARCFGFGLECAASFALAN